MMTTIFFIIRLNVLEKKKTPSDFVCHRCPRTPSPESGTGRVVVKTESDDEFADSWMKETRLRRATGGTRGTMFVFH